MNRSRRWPARAAAALLVAALLLLARGSRDKFGPLAAGSPAPDYGAVTLTGDTVSLHDYAGRVVLLNVWATWCTPCLREMPSLQRLHERLAARGLSVLAVSVDAPLPGAQGPPPAVARWAIDLGLTFDILHDASGELERNFDVAGLPVTFVITRDGRIHRKVIGARDWTDSRHAQEIEELLSG